MCRILCGVFLLTFSHLIVRAIQWDWNHTYFIEEEAAEIWRYQMTCPSSHGKGMWLSERWSVVSVWEKDGLNVWFYPWVLLLWKLRLDKINLTGFLGPDSWVDTGFVYAKLTFHLIQSVPTKAGVAQGWEWRRSEQCDSQGTSKCIEHGGGRTVEPLLTSFKS